MVAGERQLNFQLFTIFRSQRITEQDFNIINLLNSFYGPEVLNLLCAKNILIIHQLYGAFPCIKNCAKQFIHLTVQISYAVCLLLDKQAKVYSTK